MVETSLLSGFSADYVNSIFDLLLQSSDRCLHIYKEFPTKEILRIQSDVFVLSAGGQKLWALDVLELSKPVHANESVSELQATVHAPIKIKVVNRQFLPDLHSTRTHVESPKSSYPQNKSGANVLHLFFFFNS